MTSVCGVIASAAHQGKGWSSGKVNWWPFPSYQLMDAISKMRNYPNLFSFKQNLGRRVSMSGLPDI